MNLKKAVIAVMDRDTLKDAVDALGLHDVDRRSVADMARHVSRARRATPAFLLDLLDERQVKAVCERLGLPATGRRRALVRRLLDHQNSAVETPNRSTRHRPRTRGTRATRRESPGMSASETPRTDAAETPVRLPEPPLGMFRITKTELVWPGKYDEHGNLREPPRINLPFQVIERVNESRATREARKSTGGLLFDIYHAQEGDTFEEGWRNKLIWGDNLLVMSSLLEKFAGKIDLIYIDPPFATGANFSFNAPIGESAEEVYKEQSLIEEKAYRDTWGAGQSTFFAMIAQRLRLMKDLLSPTGSIYVHMDYRLGPAIKVLLDELLGKEQFRNEVIWYYSGGGASREQWARKHDNIYYYNKGSQWTFNVDDVRQEYKWVDGQKRADGSDRDLERGKLPDDVFDLHGILPWASEKTGFETQKPETLLERIVKASSNPGDLVADFFCGSGTTLAVAEKLGRRWIGCDLGRWAIHVTRKRLLGIENCRPFEVLNSPLKNHLTALR